MPFKNDIKVKNMKKYNKIVNNATAFSCEACDHKSVCEHFDVPFPLIDGCPDYKPTDSLSRADTVGEAIKDIRKTRGITQKQLGIMVGFPESTADIRIAQYESGSRQPKQELLSKICSALNCTISVVQYAEYTLNPNNNCFQED